MTGTKVAYQVGTMIELPRASLRAAEIAETAEFFSFGTNDLTQTAFGISRDDAASFLGTYMARGILASDPFVSIDREGVGELVRIGVERGRKTKAKLKVGILRRARRRPHLRRVLPRDCARLRLVLAVPRSHRTPRRRPRRDQLITRGFAARVTRTSQGPVPHRRGVQHEGQGSGEIRREELPPSVLHDGLSP